jgi:hypothetical protein
VGVLFFAAGLSFGQTAAGKPAFEVASVRPSAPLDMQKLAAQMQAGTLPRMGAHVDGSRAEYDYMSLKDRWRKRKKRRRTGHRAGVAGQRAIRYCGEDS